jgi:lysophospholipase L1-like esterase
VDDLAVMLRGIRPDIQTVNFGCPGETSLTFINGGCNYTSRGFSLHNGYSGPQLSAALAFLQEHPGQVSPITINIGGNDFNRLQSICGSDLSCYEVHGPAILAATRANLDQILGAIRNTAPNAEIITFTTYDLTVLVDPRFGRFTAAFNDVVTDTARSHSVRVADVFGAFNDGPQPPFDPLFEPPHDRLVLLHAILAAAEDEELLLWLGREKYISTEDRAFHDKEVSVASQLIDLEPQAKDRYLRAMANWWKFAQIGLRDDLFSYYYIELDTLTGAWRPLPKSIKPRQQWNSPSMWQNGTFPVCWGEVAARLSLSSAMLAHRSQEHRRAR